MISFTPIATVYVLYKVPFNLLGNKQEVGIQGNIAVDCTGGKPVGLFKEYLDDPVRTKATMLGNYYITGDKGYKDNDGYIWFDSRSDDVIISSGYDLSLVIIQV